MPIKINGATSGSTTITAPATGGDESIELSTALAGKGDYTDWTTFTPTFSGITVGNGTLINCQYSRIGNIIICQVGLKWGSTTAFTGVGDFSLPVTSVSYTGNPNLGVTRYIDAGASQYNGIAVYINTTTVRLQTNVVSGSQIIAGEVGASAPFTWTTNDEMHALITYEAA